MKKLVTFTTVLLLVLPLSLGIKLAVVHDVRASLQRPSTASAYASVFAFLEKHGAEAGALNNSVAQDGVQARRGLCEIRIISADPHGYDSGIITQLVKKDDDLLFVFGGKIFNIAPLWRSKFTHLRARLYRKFGVSYPAPNLFAVIQNSPCRDLALPLEELSMSVSALSTS